jgi:hypothetical protein
LQYSNIIQHLGFLSTALLQYSDIVTDVPLHVKRLLCNSPMNVTKQEALIIYCKKDTALSNCISVSSKTI